LVQTALKRQVDDGIRPDPLSFFPDNTILHKFSICSLDYLDHKRIARSDYAPGRFVMLLFVHQGWAKVLSTYGIVVEERTQQLVAIFVDNYHDDTSQFLRP